MQITVTKQNIEIKDCLRVEFSLLENKIVFMSHDFATMSSDGTDGPEVSPEPVSKFSLEEKEESGILFQRKLQPSGSAIKPLEEVIPEEKTVKQRKARPFQSLAEIKEKIIKFIENKGGSGTFHYRATKESDAKTKEEYRKISDEIVTYPKKIKQALLSLIAEGKLKKQKKGTGKDARTNIFIITGKKTYTKKTYTKNTKSLEQTKTDLLSFIKERGGESSLRVTNSAKALPEARAETEALKKNVASSFVVIKKAREELIRDRSPMGARAGRASTGCRLCKV